jgi:hypothetical protein
LRLSPPWYSLPLLSSFVCGVAVDTATKMTRCSRAGFVSFFLSRVH